MITLSIRFLAGRFHATQWGRHVNEGVPEWPPSPWRILRCLISTWKTKCPEISEEMARTILGKLSEQPDFALPPASLAHTRHYMPWDKTWLQKREGSTTLVFDTFVAAAPATEVVVCWPEANLSASEASVLSDWLDHVGYLGRAESWCEMKLLSESEAGEKAAGINCRPLGTRTPDQGTEIIRVLCPDPSTAFQATHTPKTTITEGKGKAKVATITPNYDPDWHICGETLWLHKEKWAEAPGSRWIRYTRKGDSFKVTPKRALRRVSQIRPQVIRFALDSAVLPLVTETLPLAEAFRRNLMGIHGRLTERPDGSKGMSEIFSGKDKDGTLLSTHGHAYYLPTDDDHDGRLDHVTLIAADGFGSEDMAAIHTLRKIGSKERSENSHTLGVLLLGVGMLEDAYTSGPATLSTMWQTATPYLCHRHPKTRGSKKDRAEELASHATFAQARLREDIDRMLQRRDDLKDISIDEIRITPLTDDSGVFRIGVRKHRPIEFQRFRQKKGDDGGKRLCGAFSITFPRPVQGPIALGHSCHFGMGLCFPIHTPP